MTIKNWLLNRQSDSKTPKEAKEHIKFSVGGMLNNFNEIYELAKEPNHQPFFIHGSEKGLVAHEPELHGFEYVIKPYQRVPWTPPTQLTNYGTVEQLWNDVKQCITDHVDLADKEAYEVLTAWVFASWTLERWKIAPYLFFFGSFGTGKTRALEVLSQLCSRGWLALYMTPANLYRPLEQWKPTLFLDEAEIYGDKHEILGLLNGSYRAGQYVSRQKDNDGNYETEFFDCFGFKAVAGTKDLAKTLKSRCIIFQTSHATRKIRFFIDEHRCTELRNKLLSWRFKVAFEDSEDSEDFEAFLEGLAIIIGNQRETELFYPLISVAPTSEIKDKLIEYAKHSAAAKLEELSLTTEATCLSAILTAKDRGLVKNGKLTIQDITSIVNENMGYDEQWKERFTSSHCSRLGFQKTRGTQGKACIIYSDPLIERLKQDQRYALCFSIPSETSSISSKSSKSLDVKDPKAMANWLQGDNPQ